MFAGLFREAEQFLRDRGMRVARGPFSLTINHESGLLVHGFDEPHVVRTNHAPPYYSRHIESLGYAKAMDLLAYVCRVSESGLSRTRRAGRGRPRRAADRIPFTVAVELGTDFPAGAGPL